ncbi:DUF6415 family natural product biosynthesis protein [Streptomyces cadmiisoli]|uniref:DUF6415 family natural product biosynthesis protein n=1 Tax=Streptomyces cadmiisoli TaxID=2184053 RepID=UPI00364F713B
MSASAPMCLWAHSMERWQPPLGREALEDVLQKVPAWQPFDGAALLDDVAIVLDDLTPPEDLHDELAQRFRGHLMRLVAIAVATRAAAEDTETAELIERARSIRSEEMPGDHRQAVGHLRRLAWTVNELLERLVATKCLKEAA